MAIRDKLTLGVIAACLAGCSSLNPLNWGSDSGPKPAELREFQATVSLKQAWATDIGGESGQGMQPDRKSTRLNSSHSQQSRMPSSA